MKTYTEAKIKVLSGEIKIDRNDCEAFERCEPSGYTCLKDCGNYKPKEKEMKKEKIQMTEEIEINMLMVGFAYATNKDKKSFTFTRKQIESLLNETASYLKGIQALKKENERLKG